MKQRKSETIPVISARVDKIEAGLKILGLVYCTNCRNWVTSTTLDDTNKSICDSCNKEIEVSKKTSAPEIPFCECDNTGWNCQDCSYMVNRKCTYAI